jgi:hypothetical protein
MISVSTAPETMEMVFIDFKRRVALDVKRAAGEAAAVHIEPIVAYKLAQINPVLNVLKYV